MQENTRAAYRDAILRAAERVFGRMGYFQAKMADLARETGVSVGTLYNYFESKEKVGLALAQREHDQFFEILEGCAELSDPLPRLEAVATSMLRFFEARGDLFSIFTNMGLSHDSECRRLGGLAGERGYMSVLKVLEAPVREAADRGLLRNDWTPRQLAALLGAMLSATVFIWLHDGRVGPLAERGKDVLDLFMKGARGT